jgi:glutathione S-transferase
MPDRSALILHQYDTSPFSEKVRKVLAHKKVAWHAVEQPTIMPKPQLLPLTGGYRRIPVLQIGADVYCDTQLIVRVLERLAPSPTLYPGRSEGTCQAWQLWADKLVFITTVSVIFAEIGQFMPKEFMDDRTKMMPGRDFNEIPKMAPHARDQLRAFIATLASQLDDGRPYLLGDAFSLADAACFHPMWFLRMAPQAKDLIAEAARVAAWFERIDAMGQGTRAPMAPDEALAIARQASPLPACGVAANDPAGLAAGMRVTVTPDDYGFDPVAGDLVAASVHEVAVRRHDPDLGELVVHFPRIGFRVVAAA